MSYNPIKQNFLTMYKLLIFLFFSLFIISAATIKQSKASTLNEGFLAVSLKSSNISQTNPEIPDNLWNFEFWVEGASVNYEIQTRIEIVPELINIGNNYDGNSSYVPSGMVHRYGLANLEVLHQVKSFDWFRIYFGARFGHYGFLSYEQSSPSFILHFSPKLEIGLFLGKYFHIKVPVEIPLALFKENLTSLFMLRSGIEFVFDPLGTITNPNPDTALYSLGVDFEYFDFDDTFLPAEVFQWKPYIKVSILY